MSTFSPWRVMFVYWGRRGGMNPFTLGVTRAAVADQRIAPTLSISRQNESYAQFGEFKDLLVPVDTFSTNVGPLAQGWRIPVLRRRMVSRIIGDGTQAVVALMPHVWMPLVAPAVRRAGARYVTIVHDADPHPGDPTTVLHDWMHRDIRHADLVVALSEAVASRLLAAGRVPRSRLLTLFLPDLLPRARVERAAPRPGEPFRLLFLGRIMPYKGLPLLLDAIEILRGENVPVHLGVLGEGPLGAAAHRLQSIGAEVVNRWLSDEEIAAALPRYHAVALSHTEASQSGVGAVALGSGMPAIANPVGGLVEQVIDGETGILAKSATAPAFADAVKRLALDPSLYRAICRNIAASKGARSMERFVGELVSHAVGATG